MGACSAARERGKHRVILLRLVCVWRLEFYCFSIQAVWRERNEADEGNVSEMDYLASRDGHGQGHSAAFSMNSSGSDLRDVIC